MSDNGRFTKKQLEILETVIKGDGGDFIDIDTMLGVLSYAPSKTALQYSMRFLEKRGYIERDYKIRNSRKRVIYKPTLLAHKIFNAGGGQMDVVIESFDEEHPEHPDATTKD